MTRTYLVLVLTALLCAPSLAQAQPVTLEFGPRGGYSISEQASFVGADFRVDEASLPFVYHLGFDYYLEAVGEGEQDAPNWQFDVNSYIPFLVYSPTITLQLGGGFSVQRTVPSTGAETDWGFNGTAGFVLNPTGTFQPFVRARATLAQESTFDAMGGLLIVLRR